MGVGLMQTCVGQNCGHAYNSMELFHAIDFLTCQPSITWNSFQAITHHTNLPCYYHLYISRLLQGCIFHALSWRLYGHYAAFAILPMKVKLFNATTSENSGIDRKVFGGDLGRRLPTFVLPPSLARGDT